MAESALRVMERAHRWCLLGGASKLVALRRVFVDIGRSAQTHAASHHLAHVGDDFDAGEVNAGVTLRRGSTRVVQIRVGVKPRISSEREGLTVLPVHRVSASG